MAARKQHSFLTLFLILVLCVNLLNVQIVHAEGETPTEPSVPTQVETEQPTEPPVQSTPEPVESTPEPVDATAVPGESTPEPVDPTAVPEQPTSEPEEEEPADPSIAEILTEVPENTEIVVLDENGESLPLVTQEAAEVVEEFDPMWCPAGVLPGGAGCTINFPSIGALISNMQSSTNTYDQNGIIYFAATTGSQTTNASLALTTTSLGNGDYNTLNDFNLTLQGGWNGQNGASATFTGVTNFGTNTVTVGSGFSPWVGSVTINNFVFNGVSSTNSITVYTTTGNIALNDVSVNQQAGEDYTAYLNSNSGNITVDDSLFDGNANDQSQGFFANTGGSGSITISDTTFSDARDSNNGSTHDGATLDASTVTLTNVIASNNDGNGITINNVDLVTLNNVTATNNGSEFGQNGFNGNIGSGVFVDGDQNSQLIINGGTFNNNQGYGIQVQNPNQITTTVQSSFTCTGNDSNTAGLGCSNDLPADSSAPVITPTITGTAGANGWYRSNVSVSWSFTDPESGILSSTGCTTSNLTADTAGVSLTCAATNNVNLSNSVTVTVKIDKTNPIISYASRTAPNASGWNNSNVVVNWTCSDSFSGPVNDIVSQTVTTEGVGQSSTGTCTDLAGNTASDTQGGINIDKTAPSLNLPSGITAEATSSAGATVTYVASATDNLDNSVVVSCVPASGSNFSLGASKVDCSSTDAAGNIANGGFVIQVGDATGPIIDSHPDITAQATGPSGAIVNYQTPAATDAVDGVIENVSCIPASGETFPLGDTTVNCEAWDQHENMSTSSFVVHVVDTTLPVIAFHSDITVEATGPNGVAVNYTAPTANDIVDGVIENVSCTPASGETFPLGNTTVTCQATDQHQNTGSSSFVVHVVDTTAPIIAPHDDITVEATSFAGALVNYTNPTASDIVDASVSVYCSPASDTTFELGDTTVTCNAMDMFGNQATAVTFTVHVVDTTAPVLSLPSTITAYATGPSGVAVTFQASANDLVDGSINVTCNQASGSVFPVGTNTVTCKATDKQKNEATGSFIINVQDPGAPILSLPSDILAEATGPSGAKVTFSVSATDVVDGPLPVTCSKTSGSTFGFGSTIVTCSATDKVGNSNSAAFLVTVQDTTAPVIAPHADVDATTTTGSTNVSYASPTTSDVVDGAGVASCSPASDSLFPLGNTTVTCTATDSHGNTSSMTFVVHVSLPKSSSSESTSTGSSFLIPLTGGELIDLDCDSILWAFGIRLSFINLCDYQTTIHSVVASDLPAALPNGASFVMGLRLDLLLDGELVEELPSSTGIEMDFPVYNQSLDQFAVLFWDDADGDGNGTWVEISQELGLEEIAQALNATGADGFYQLSAEADDATALFYQILTAQKTGVFILVQK